MFCAVGYYKPVAQHVRPIADLGGPAAHAGRCMHTQVRSACYLLQHPRLVVPGLWAMRGLFRLIPNGASNTGF